MLNLFHITNVILIKFNFQVEISRVLAFVSLAHLLTYRPIVAVTPQIYMERQHTIRI